MKEWEQKRGKGRKGRQGGLGREGRLKVKVEAEGRERKKDINRKGSCVEVGIC